MVSTSTLRAAACAGLRAADPEAAVTRWLEDNSVVATWSSVVIIAFGKAAPAMTRAAAAVFEDRLEVCLVISDHREAVPPECEVMVAGHPVPDDSSVAAGERALDVARTAGPDSTMLFLVSGGGSALLEVPAGRLTVDEVAAATQALLTSGAPIEDLNAVRVQLSDTKGGRLAAAVSGDHVTLAVSDVVGSPPHVIASGPTVAPVGSAVDALAALTRWGVDRTVPASVVEHLRSAVAPAPATTGSFHIVADGSLAAHAARRDLEAAGHEANVCSVSLAGEARHSAIEAHSAVPPGTVGVFAGETTVRVAGAGIGGRNQEAALALAVTLAGSDDVALCIGSDGIDGPTDAAGAVVDGDSLAGLETAGIDVAVALQANDSYHALDAIDALIRTGPTGTNVGDLWLISRA